jgi:2'-5' RNA ligase
MEYSVIMCFNSIKQIDKMIEQIGEKTNNYMIINKVPPHVTLTTFSTEEKSVTKIFKKFIDVKPFPITLKTKGYGTFNGESNSIFIDIEKTDEVIKLMNKYISKMLDVEHKDYFNAVDYHPHMTIATNLDNAQLELAQEIAKEYKIPKSITISSIRCIDENYNSFGIKNL